MNRICRSQLNLNADLVEYRRFSLTDPLEGITLCIEGVR